jgi:hypothetical protein
MKSSVIALFLITMSIGFVCQNALAQDTTGRIVGTVYDPQGGVIPGVKVAATNTATQVTRDATSDREGYFQILLLPIGNYRLTAERDGFQPFSGDEHKLSINQSLKIDFNMAISNISSTVEVHDKPSNVETVDATLGQSVTSRALINMPLNGRDVLDLALLQPGVTESNDDNGGAGNFSIAGSRTDSVTYLLDGGQNNDLIDNSQLLNPNPDAIAEFRLLTSNYTAEFGRNGGGIISVVTKSGTNSLHGSGFEFLRNRSFNANDFFNKLKGLPRDDLKRNQFGATLGGPIRKDRLFFFVAYQSQRQVLGQAAIDNPTFPTAQLNGDFSGGMTGGTCPNADPNVAAFLVTNPFFQSDPAKANCAIIDPNSFNSVAKAYIKNNLIPTTTSGLISYQTPTRNDRDEVTSKVDFDASSKDKISFTYGLNRNPVLSPGGFATVPGYSDTLKSWYYFFNSGYTRIFSPTLINEFHFVTHRSTYLNHIPVAKLSLPSALGIAVTPDIPTGPTNLNFVDVGAGVGFDENGPTNYIENTFSWTDTVSKTHGKHNWKFGGGFTPYQENLLFDFQINGHFDFNGGTPGTTGVIGSGNSYADFLLGIPEDYVQGASAPSNIRSKNTFGFAQDEWHVRKNLVLTLGLRYEYNTPKTDTHDRTFSIIPGEQSSRFVNAPVGLVFPGDRGAPNGTNFTDKSNFAPRFGFAWDPRNNGKTSIRGGFGIFYDILKGEDNLQYNGQPPFVANASLFFAAPPANSGPITFMNDPFGSLGFKNPFPSKPPRPNFSFAPPVEPINNTGSIFVTDPHLNTPRIYQYNLSVQRDLVSSIVLEVNYVGSSSHKLTSLQDINPIVLGTTNRVLNLTPGNSTCDTNTPNSCNFDSLPEFRNVSHGNYNSLEASLTRQVKDSPVGTVYFTLAYTYSHNIDNASGFRQRNSTVPAYNPNQFYASGDSDIRHRIVFSGGWDLPFDRAWNSGPKRLTKGWSLYPILSWRTGFPFDVPARLSGRNDPTYAGTSGAGDPFLTNASLVAPVHYLNPDQTVTINVGGTPVTGNFYFDPNSFSNTNLNAIDAVNNPSQRTYGLVRNFLRGPHQTNVDMALAKTTSITERVNLEFRVEAFNLFNHPEFAIPDTNIDHSTFGQVTSTGTFRGSTPRILQLAARIAF